MFDEFVFSTTTSFIISVAIWRTLVAINRMSFKRIFTEIWRILTLQLSCKFIKRKEGQLLRSGNVLLYAFQNFLYEFKRWTIIFGMLIGAIVLASILAEPSLNMNTGDWITFWGASFAGIVAIIIYDQTRTNNEQVEYEIRRNNDLIHIQYCQMYKGKEYAKLQLVYAIDEILTYVDHFLEDVKLWLKEKDANRKNTLREICDEDWNAIIYYKKILENEDYKKFFDSNIESRIKKVSDACDTIPKFDITKNVCKIETLEIIVVQSLLIFKKLEVHTIHRRLIGYV